VPTPTPAAGSPFVPQTVRDCFRGLPDPRVVGRTTHALDDILAIVFLATLAGCDDFVTMADYADAKQQWLRERVGLELRNGIPSHDVLTRVMAALHPDHFATAFERLVTVLIRHAPALANQHIAIDGKALRGSKNREKRMVHMVGAWATNAGLALGQVPTAEKSNEITAIPKLLEILDLSGALVTIDAAGCQTDIAAQIVTRGGDYLLQVKGNQERLHDDVRVLAEAAMEENLAGLDVWEDGSGKKRHGRRESRTCFVIDDPVLLRETIRDFERWPQLRSVVVTIGEREVGGATSVETRYQISNRTASAAAFGVVGRRHWAIENECHWVLDVAFREDDHRLREGHAAANLSVVRRMALSVLKRSNVKLGIRNRRLKASYDNDFLESLLAEVFKDFDA
jgi:predicted transposase YbfD/YdcC